MASQPSIPIDKGGASEIAAGARWRNLSKKLALLLVSGLLAFGVGEAMLRTFFRDAFFIVQDERNLMYQYDRALGWLPVPNSRDRLLGSRVFTVAHSSEGLRQSEHAENSKPGIIFLGDSFVWGYDVDAEERFTDKLQTRHPEWDVSNFGVSGYGTDQEYLLLQQKFQRYKPRVVFLMFCTETDDADNSSNVRYGGYYKPYCTISGQRLKLNGVPVPRSERAICAEHPKLATCYMLRLGLRTWLKLTSPPVLHNPVPTGAIIRDMQKYLANQGATFLVGLTSSSPRLEEFLRHFSIPFVDLSNKLRYPKFGEHWTPEGHTFVCDRIDAFLREGNFLGDANKPEIKP